MTPQVESALLHAEAVTRRNSLAHLGTLLPSTGLSVAQAKGPFLKYVLQISREGMPPATPPRYE